LKAPAIFFVAPLHIFGCASTISRFGERFRDGQYSLVSFLFPVFLLTVPSRAQLFVKVGTRPSCRMVSTPLVRLPLIRDGWIHEPVRTLRSSSSLLLSVPRCNLELGSRAFRISAPKIWNSPSASIRDSPSLPTFRRHLKTHYFQL